MATISIKYSQDVVDRQNDSKLNIPQLNGSLGTLLDAVIIAGYSVQRNYTYYSSWDLVGSTLRMNFPDGATKTYTGFAPDNPEALQGGAMASGFEFYKNGMVSIAEHGALNFEYSLTPSATGYDLSFQGAAKGSSLTSYRLATQLPTASSEYDSLMGNVAIVIKGALSLQQSGQTTGNITKILTTADKFLLSGVIDGNFQVAADALTVGQGLAHAEVSGILTGYKEDYRDGSHAYVSGISTYVDASQVLDQAMFSDASRFAGNDDISIELPGHSYSDFVIASGRGDDRISVKGGGGRLIVDAGGGDDQINILSDAHVIDGGAGIDTVTLSAVASSYRVQHTSSGYAVIDSAGASSTLLNVERLAFLDAAVALDTGGSGGQVYRLYQAAFNRAPDMEGLGYHLWRTDVVGLSLTEVAQNFIDSPEFVQTYGSLNNRDFVIQLYANVLHRAPDEGGLNYHTDLLNAGTITRAMDLVGFSESPENQAALIGIIGNGFEYTPHVG